MTDHTQLTEDQLEGLPPSIVRQRKLTAAFQMGVRDAIAAGTEDAFGSGTSWAETDDDMWFDLNEQYDRGVNEGFKRVKMTPIDRARIVLDWFSFTVGAELGAILDEVRKGARFLTVTIDDDNDKWPAVYDTLEEAWDGLAEEITGERSWWPYAIFDLTDGRSIPHGVSVKVYESDAGSTCVGDIGTEGPDA